MTGSHFRVKTLIFSLVFVGLGSIAITNVGLYYDEVHQAPASFIYKGLQSPFFNFYSFHGIPLMNMTYSGALKSHLYGFYLFLFNQDFSVLSWRMMGLLTVGLSLFLFGMLTGRIIPGRSLTLFYLLFISDVSILMMTRHDWGPVALALSLRILFIAFWIKGELENHPDKINSFILGLIAGISFYEKLSSLVLIMPLIYILLFNKERRSAKHFIVAFLGLTLGSIPVIAINLDTWIRQGVFFSLHEVKTTIELSISGFINYIPEYISLGAGKIVREFILGSSTPTIVSTLETILMVTLLSGSLLFAWLNRQRGKFTRLYIISLLSYLSIGSFIYFLPQHTWCHHWIIGTPFQYITIALLFASINYDSRELSHHRIVIMRRLNLVLVIALLALRSYLLVAVENDLIRGKISYKWSMEYTKLGQFAAQQPDDVLFIAGDWGIATQIYCLGNGRTNIIEVFSKSPFHDDHLKEIVSSGALNCIYLMFNERPIVVNDSTAADILSFVSILQGYNETDIVDALKFKNIKIFKYTRDISGKL
jgi:hypothetical protein